MIVSAPLPFDTASKNATMLVQHRCPLLYLLRCLVQKTISCRKIVLSNTIYVIILKYKLIYGPDTDMFAHKSNRHSTLYQTSCTAFGLCRT